MVQYISYSRGKRQKPGFFDFVALTTQKGISSDLSLIIVDKLQVKVYGVCELQSSIAPER